MNKFYHIGNGQCVVPGMKKPWDCNYCGLDSNPRYKEDMKVWEKHLASLPKTHECDPKEPVGWLEGYQEDYQVWGADTGWRSVEKRLYEIHKEEFPQQSRIFLVPKLEQGEEKETRDEFIKWLDQETYDLKRSLSLSISVNGMFDKVLFQMLIKRMNEVKSKYNSLSTSASQPQDELKWVKASERLPEREGVYAVKRVYSQHPETAEFTGRTFANYNGYEVVEWLFEPNTH